MPAVIVLLVVLAIYALGYRYYSSYLARRVYALDPAYVTPAHRYSDGVDFVPTNKHIVFAHHFISIAGAAPIVGPAIAVFWGWLPALLWVVLGTVFAAGAHDFGALVVSLRHKARSIGTVARDVISTRARTLFLLIIYFLVTMVNAVFAVVIATLLVNNPEAVLPVLLTIPLAIGVGQYVYRKRTAALLPSLLALVIVYSAIWLGQHVPITVDPIANAVGLQPMTVWILLIFAYTFFASRLPVWVLLQPRDYINQQQMVLALLVIMLGVLIGWNTIAAPAVHDVPEGSPPWFPLLFITIACGAVSGFHSLVSSGTTAKQLNKESDARYVGYLGSLGEGTLALCSILAATAGVVALSATPAADWQARYADWETASDGALGTFTEGVAGFANNLGVPVAIGTVFAAVVVISFAATSLDTAVRLQRYIVQEIAEMVGLRAVARNLTLATAVALSLPIILALLPGDFAFGTLWQLFGTTNQLTAGLALAVIAVWVTRRRRNPIVILIPLVFLVTMTSWALLIQLHEFATSADPLEVFLLAPLDAIIFLLAVWLIIEAAVALRRAWAARAVEADAGEESAVRSGEHDDR
ncbi:carbon starvation protein A [Haloechinothrix sp. LS1_15]|uniref:carbon starvation CstA family protein n=1 Tax=Haloechinothrix sp. LS1_15 TaxID=2652248 RepID=UPI00294548C4|nr:carbon starvation protein A [Haloechinothrix sp. LS1_15]MDV6013405.1 carbon starvation protein A [Haloechinothrix sp. LS1_15]